MRRQVSLGFVIWLVIGLVVAANNGFLGNLNSLSGVLSAVLAVLAWPLVVLDVHVAIGPAAFAQCRWQFGRFRQ